MNCVHNICGEQVQHSVDSVWFNKQSHHAKSIAILLPNNDDNQLLFMNNVLP